LTYINHAYILEKGGRMKKSKRKLIKFSNYSFCITLPKSAIDAMAWKKGDTVNATFDEKAKKIVVTKSKIVSKPSKKKGSSPQDLKEVPELHW